jgi:hypothetical protein
MHRLVLSMQFQGNFYAITAFSAKASEVRPRPHDPLGFPAGGMAPGAKVDGDVMLVGSLVGINEWAPGASVLSRR